VVYSGTVMLKKGDGKKRDRNETYNAVPVSRSEGGFTVEVTEDVLFRRITIKPTSIDWIYDAWVIRKNGDPEYRTEPVEPQPADSPAEGEPAAQVSDTPPAVPTVAPVPPTYKPSGKFYEHHEQSEVRVPVWLVRTLKEMGIKNDPYDHAAMVMYVFSLWAKDGCHARGIPINVHHWEQALLIKQGWAEDAATRLCKAHVLDRFEKCDMGVKGNRYTILEPIAGMLQEDAKPKPTVVTPSEFLLAIDPDGDPFAE
jgi:hypothetical protein